MSSQLIPLIPTVSAPLTGSHLEALKTSLDIARKEFGHPVRLRDAAAASAAGFVLISKLMGYEVRAVELHRIPGNTTHQWAAFLDFDADYLTLEISSKTDLLSLFKCGLHYVAGTAGESLAGFFHQACSLPDRYRSTICGLFLEEKIYGVAHGRLAEKIAFIALELICNYMAEFNQLRTCIAESSEAYQANYENILYRVKALNLQVILRDLQV